MQGKSLSRTNALMSKVFCIENERNAYTYNVLTLTSQYFHIRRVARGCVGGPVVHHAYSLSAITHARGKKLAITDHVNEV